MKFNDLAQDRLWLAEHKKLVMVVEQNGIAVVFGDRGIGKTQSAVEAIRGQVELGKTCMYMRCREVGMKLREAYGGQKRKISESKAIAEFVKPHLLVLDECQEKNDSDWEGRSLTLMIDMRYGAMKPTILIANVITLDRLQGLFGASIVDRIKEDGGGIHFKGRSFRGGDR